MHSFYLTLFILSPKVIHGSLSDTSRTESKGISIPILQELINNFQDKTPDDGEDKKSAQNKSNALKTAHEKTLSSGRHMPPSIDTATTRSHEKIKVTHHFHLDPEFNSVKNRRLWQKKKEKSSSTSSEIDAQTWMDEVVEEREQLKFLAMNTTHHQGDVVNMKAARPWGVQCGDSNQHDLPWGTCMLPAECDAEYRIYRGDSFCGRNSFVCCALDRTSYDMYQGLDLSFQRENSLTTDTEDERNQNSRWRKEQIRKRRKREKSRKKRNKKLLKKKLRNSIKNIVTAITKLLQRAYRNRTEYQAKKTKELKEFILNMKKQYRKDRNSLMDAHEFNMAKYETELSESMSKVRDVNQAFLLNDTFRDIVVNGTVNKENLLRLQKTHPVLSLFFNNRRMGGGDLESEPEKIKLEIGGEEPESEENEKQSPKHVEYDLEYGMLYY